MTSKTRITLCVLAVLLVALGAYVLSARSQPDKAACKAAMSAQFDRAIANPDGPEGTKPAACNGVSDADLTRMAEELISEKMGTLTN